MLTQAQSVWQSFLCVKSKQTHCLTSSSSIREPSLRSPYHQVRESMCVQRLPIRSWLPRRQQPEKWWSLQNKPIYLSDVEEEHPASVVCVSVCVRFTRWLNSHHSCSPLNTDVRTSCEPYQKSDRQKKCSALYIMLSKLPSLAPHSPSDNERGQCSHWPMSTLVLTPYWLAPPFTLHQWGVLYPWEWSL